MNPKVTGPFMRKTFSHIKIFVALLGLCVVSVYFHKTSQQKTECMDQHITRFHEEPKTIQGDSHILADGAWIVNSVGRLGNQMGEYATLYALAKLHRRPAYILPEMFNWLAPIFKIRMPQMHQSVVKKINWRHYRMRDWMSEEYKHLSGKFVHLLSTPCSWTFYHHIRDEILREFTFHDYITEEANQFLETLKGSRKNVTYIGVHVRRGDYLTVMPDSWKGVVADKGYLEKAMKYFRDKYEEPVFVVTSNGMQWCKENINSSRGDVFFSGDSNESSPGKDFSLLAHCNHTIMTIGTFGYWASYLAGGEVIYLDNYTLPDSPFLKVFHYDAAFLPEWIGIPADLSPLLAKKS